MCIFFKIYSEVLDIFILLLMVSLISTYCWYVDSRLIIFTFSNFIFNNQTKHLISFTKLSGDSPRFSTTTFILHTTHSSCVPLCRIFLLFDSLFCLAVLAQVSTALSSGNGVSRILILFPISKRNFHISSLNTMFVLVYFEDTLDQIKGIPLYS